MLPATPQEQNQLNSGEATSILNLDAERQLSTNFFWRVEVEGQTFDMQTTVRDSNTSEQVEAHMKAVSVALHYIRSHGGSSKTVGSFPGITTVPHPAQAGSTATASATPAVPAQANRTPTPAPASSAPTSSAPVSDADMTFQAEELIVTIGEKGKTFKITGGKYMKFGVTAYPEVLSKHFDLEAMVAGRYSIPNYTVYCVKPEGKPMKVGNLVPLASVTLAAA